MGGNRAQVHDIVERIEEIVIVGDRKNRSLSIPSRIQQLVQDHPLVAGIEISGGFIGEHEARPRHQSPTDRGALPLTLAQSGHRSTRQMVDAEPFQEFAGVGSGVAVQIRGSQTKRQEHVSKDVQMVKESEVLEHDADPGQTDPTAGIRPQSIKPGSIELDLPGFRGQYPRCQPEQGRLPAAAGTDDRHRPTTTQLERWEFEPECGFTTAGSGIVESDAFESKHGGDPGTSGVDTVPAAAKELLSMRIDRRLAFLLVLLPTLLAPIACETDSLEETDPANLLPTVVATNYPMKFFIQRIAGPRVAIEWMVPDGADPADWQPTADDVARMNAADLVVLNGAGYEQWLETVSLSPGAVLDTSAGFQDQLIEIDGRVHSHGPEGSHSHAGTATHTWLDPDLAIKQADAIRAALSELLPAEQDAMQSNFGLLRRDLLIRSASLEQAVNTRPETPVVFSHPVYQYLQRRYRMNGQSVHFEPELEPDTASVNELDALLAAQPSTWFIWEGPPIPENEKLLREQGLRSVIFPPGGAEPESGDLLDVFDTGIESLRRVYDAPEDS